MKKITLFLICISINTAVFSQTWTAQTSGVTGGLNCFYFMDDNNGFVVGLSGKILKTTNGGTLWSPLTSSVTTDLYSTYFSSATTGYAVGDGGKIIKTVNAGASWATLTSGSSANLRYVYFADSLTGYTCGSGGTILKTINAGVTWTALTSSTSVSLLSMYFTSSSIGYAVGGNGTILNTINSGASWTPQTSGLSSSLNYVFFTDNVTGYIVGSGGIILKTINAGVSWTQQSVGSSLYLTSVKFLDANTGFVVGGNIAADTSSIFKTHDAGATWNLERTIYSRQYGSCFPSFGAGYTCGTQGSILKTAGINTSINDSFENHINLSVSPNPFSSSFVLSFDLEKNSNVKISMLDMLGKECSVVSSGNILKGNHQLTIELNSLPSGIYFVQINTGNTIETKKIIKE